MLVQTLSSKKKYVAIKQTPIHNMLNFLIGFIVGLYTSPVTVENLVETLIKRITEAAGTAKTGRGDRKKSDDNEE